MALQQPLTTARNRRTAYMLGMKRSITTLKRVCDNPEGQEQDGLAMIIIIMTGAWRKYENSQQTGHLHRGEGGLRGDHQQGHRDQPRLSQGLRRRGSTTWVVGADSRTKEGPPWANHGDSQSRQEGAGKVGGHTFARISQGTAMGA